MTRFNDLNKQATSLFKNIKKNIGYMVRTTYQADSFDHITGDSMSARQYRRNPLTIFSTLIGLPNHLNYQKGYSNKYTWDYETKLTGKKLWRNFVGLQDNKTPGRKKINYALSPFVFLFHLSLMLPTIALNTAKLFTEILPMALFKIFIFFYKATMKLRSKHLMGAYGKLDKACAKIPGGIFLRILLAIPTLISVGVLYALSAASIVGAVASLAGYFVGNTITSPIESVRASWFWFNSPEDEAAIAMGMTKRRSTGEKIFRVIVGGAVASLSIFSTIAMYTLIFAPLLPLMGVNGALLTAKLAPGFVSFLASLVGPHFTALAGLTTFAALVITIPGTVANDIINFIKFKWETTHNRKHKPVDEMPTPDKPVKGTTAQLQGTLGNGSTITPQPTIAPTREELIQKYRDYDDQALSEARFERHNAGDFEAFHVICTLIRERTAEEPRVEDVTEEPASGMTYNRI